MLLCCRNFIVNQRLRVTDRGQVSYWLLKFCHLVVLTAVNHKLRSSSKLPLLCYLPTFELPPKLGKV